MNSFNARQLACLKGIGLPLWKLQPSSPLSEAVALVKNDHRLEVSTDQGRDAQLVDPTTDRSAAADEIRRVLTWCQQSGNHSVELQWRIDPRLSESVLSDALLHTPESSKLIASPALKKQLWQLLSQRHG